MPLMSNTNLVLLLLLLPFLHACSNGTNDEDNSNKNDSVTRISIDNTQFVVAENFSLNLSCSGPDCARLYYEVNATGMQAYQPNDVINISNYNEKLLQLQVVARNNQDAVSAEASKNFYVDIDNPVSTINIDGGKFAIAPQLDLSCDDHVDSSVPVNGYAGCKEIWASLSESNYQLVKSYDKNGVAGSHAIPTPKIGDKLYYFSVDYLGNKEPLRNTNLFYVDTLYGYVRNTRRSAIANGWRIEWDAPEDSRFSEFLVCRSSISRSDICAESDIVYQGSGLVVDDTSQPQGDVYYQIFSRMPAAIWLTPPRENGPVAIPGVSNLTLLASYQQVELKWNNPSAANIDFIKVFRKTAADPDPSFSAGGAPDLNYLIKHFDYTSGASVPVMGSYIDNGLTNNLVEGETYYYAVYVEYSGTNYSPPQVEPSTMPTLMKIVDTSPVAAATEVARNIAQISISASDALDSSKLTLSPLQLRLSYGIDTPYVDVANAATYDSSAANRILFGIPRLALNAEYSVHFDADIRSLQNAPLQQAHQYDWGFTSADGVWGAAHTLMLTPFTDLEHPLQAVVDSDEHVLVVWQQNTPIPLIAAREGAAGVEWKQDTVAVISDPNYASVAPKLAINPQGQAVVAWIQKQDAVPDSLYLRRYLPGQGWELGGAHLIQQSTGLISNASSDLNVVDFTLDINEDGDVFVLWDVKDALGNGDLNINYFKFDSPDLINSYTVLPSSTQHQFSDLDLVLHNRSAALPGTGIARCSWVDSGSGNVQLTLYDVRFDANASAVASVPRPVTSVHGDVTSAITSRPNLSRNRAGDIALIWVETYSAGASSVEYDIVAARYRQSSGSWSAPVKLASLSAMPSTRVETAIANHGDVLVAWGDANGSQANYLAYFDAKQQAWQSNGSVTGVGSFAFQVSDQLLSHIGAHIDEAGNADIVATTTTGVYALRKPHHQDLQTWSAGGNLPFMVLYYNGAGFVSGQPRLIHNRLGETLAFWVGGNTSSFVYPGFNLFR